MHTKNPKGSLWHRWEPHIHIPGTILNNQYPSTDSALSDFCDRIEQSEPAIRALGVTDYYTIASYERLVEMKRSGRLANVELIFPNVELRFKIATASSKPINGHLLFSPEDPNHIEEIKRFLHKLTFSTGIEDFFCQENDLIKLGRSHDSSITTDQQALEVGTNQFKVDFDQLKKIIAGSTWAQENLLIAVAGGSRDGTSGLQTDASFSSTRQSIERASNIIFSSSEKQRAFWLGKGVMSKADIINTYNSCKPCLHGSDAHQLDSVGSPTENKYSWIKGDITFESLRQACIDPDDRAFVAEQPPENQVVSYVIDKVEITNADWMTPAMIEINPGLVTVIGARGSGKTALADMIATGGYAISEQLSDTSFIKRAYDHLADTSVTLQWLSGSRTTQHIRNTDAEYIMDYPHVQYLSQKFVDQLCSSEGMTDRLIIEIEKVIFNAHPNEERLGISDFQELLAQRASEARSDRNDQEKVIANTSEDITNERAKRRSLPILEKKRDDLTKEIDQDKVARSALLSKDKDERLKRLADVTTALDNLSGKLDRAQNKLRTLNSLKQDINSARITTFPNYNAKLKESRADAALSDREWELFEVDYKGDVDSLLTQKIDTVNNEISLLKGAKFPVDPNRSKELPFVAQDAILEEQPYELLSLEAERLKTLIGIDTENAKQYSRLSDRILKAENDLVKIKNEITDAGKAQDRINDLMSRRKEAYKQVFEAILAEEKQLKELYSPLMTNLQTQTGSLSKLSFVVRRHADIEKWAMRGEDLLDLRKMGPFRGKGSLLEAVDKELRQVWENGTADQISEALSAFRDNHEKGIIEHAQAERQNQAEFANWANRISEWLYSTDHISISYGVSYDNVDIRQLSPGTRGIVLLLLYLAIDQEDDRPLIIDQPEENLDPKSIFDELVPLFKEAKKRRQIIIVTHNANLVVNTDADQVIIASAGSHEPGKLPDISYESGGLENPLVRDQVCEILEGGKAAFVERAKRLRVAF